MIVILLRYGWHGNTALKALIQADREDRLFVSYTADCLGMFMRLNGVKDLPLYSELIAHKKPQREKTPKEVIDHVRALFSQ